MPSRKVFIKTTEVDLADVGKGIHDIQARRGFSPPRPNIFLFGDNNFDENGDGTVDAHNPVSVWVTAPGLTSETHHDGRNSMETRPSAQFELRGSGTAGTDFETSKYNKQHNRTFQGEIRTNHLGIVTSSFDLPTPG